MHQNHKWLVFIFGLVLVSCATSQRYRSFSSLKPSVLKRQWVFFPKKAGRHRFEWSAPRIWDRSLLFGNRSTGLFAFYPKFQQFRWKLSIPGGVLSEIEIDSKSRAYFVSAEGWLYAVGLFRAQVLWKYFLKTLMTSKPVFYQGRVFVNRADDTVVALDAGTGQWLWEYKHPKTVSVLQPTIRRASFPTVLGNQLVVGFSSGDLVALRLENGALLWKEHFSSARKFQDIDAHPVLERGVFYIPAYDGKLYVMKSIGRQILWTFQAGGAREVTLEKHRLYLPSSGGVVFCLNKKTGAKYWEFPLDKGIPTKVVLTPKYALVGSSQEYFYVLDKITGALIDRFDVGVESGFDTAALWSAKKRRIYLLSRAGGLYVFSLKKHAE